MNQKEYIVYIKHTQSVIVKSVDRNGAIEQVEAMLQEGYVPEDSDSPYEYVAEPYE